MMKLERETENNMNVLVTVDLERESSMNKLAGISSSLRKLVGEKIANFILENIREFLSFADTLPPKRYRKSEKGALKLLDLFNSLGIRATFFSTGKMALEKRPLVRKIVREGHEVGSHGLKHENFKRLPPAVKRDRIEKSTEILKDITGDRITSFRAPYHLSSPELFNILENGDYLIESSGRGLFPKFLESNSGSRKNKGILKVPVSHGSELLYPNHIGKKGWKEIYQTVIDRQVDRNNKIVVIGLHSQTFSKVNKAGAGQYIRLKKFLGGLKGKVNFLTMKDFYEILNKDYTKREEI